MKQEIPPNQVIENIPFHTNRPTEVTFRQLHNWVIWQLPRHKLNGLMGAVHPPLAGYGWLPAVILLKEKRVQVYAHLNTPFASPEEAIEFVGNMPETGQTK